MKGYDNKFLEELKYKNDIVEVISQYIKLEQRGKNYWGVCPFHHEKTPSFAVNGVDQYFHCFGCHKGGDVIRFIMDYESLEFSDAVKFLAERAKMPLPEFDIDSEKIKETKKLKELYLDIMHDTAYFYVRNLRSEKGLKHLEYCYNREITREAISTFGIGASLDFEGLPNYLKEKGYDLNKAVDCGVLGVKNGRFYDALGGRLILPIINQFSEVIAFGGRSLEKKPQFGKYVNTKETMLFSKSNSLYGINNLKKLKNEEGVQSVIIVEGNIDVISLYMAGFKNVVASMGTAFTKEHARILKRYCGLVYVCFDGDSAGRKAALRGLEILKEEGLNLKVVSLPEGFDPDDMIKKRGAEAFENLLKEAMPLIDFKLETLKRSYDLKTLDGKRSYIESALAVIKESDSPAEQEDLLKALRKDTGITYESLKRQLENIGENSGVKTEPIVSENSVGDKLTLAKRFILYSVLFNKSYAKNFDVNEIDFDINAHKEIAEYVSERKKNGSLMRPNALYELDGEDKKELDRIFEFDAEENKRYDEEKFFNDSCKTVKRAMREKEIAEIKKSIAETDDIKLRRQLAEKLNEILKKRV